MVYSFCLHLYTIKPHYPPVILYHYIPLYTSYIPAIYQLYTSYIPAIYQLYTSYILCNIIPLYTPITHSHASHIPHSPRHPRRFFRRATIAALPLWPRHQSCHPPPKSRWDPVGPEAMEFPCQLRYKVVPP